jgi:hypothetical protein
VILEKQKNEYAPPNNVPNFSLEVRLLSWKFTSLIMDERRLPNANLASIPESKIVDYLLSDKHRVGKSKAAFFKSFGFSHERWQELKDALCQHVLKNSLAQMEQTLYGMRYIVDGDLQAPDGSSPRIRSVWFVHTGEIVPKFITAHPLKRNKS